MTGINGDWGAKRFYDRLRAEGHSHDEAFSLTARRVARRRVPLEGYKDGDTITFGGHWDAPVVSDDFDEQVRYWEMRLNGQSHNMAEMLATRSFPGTRGTDRAFMQGRSLDGSQFEGMPPIVGREYVKKALAAGVNPTGKYYSGPLARFPGDPRAWVDGLGDVRRVAAERGVEVSGAIDVVPPRDLDRPDPGPYRVADDILNAEVAEAVEADPGLAPRRDEVRADLAHRLAGVHGTKRQPVVSRED